MGKQIEKDSILGAIMRKIILTGLLGVLSSCGYLSWPECFELIGDAEELVEKESSDVSKP